MEAGYVSVCDRFKVNIYDGRTATITVSDEAVLKGWRFPRTKLWRISLRSLVTYLNMHTLILNGPTGNKSLNYLYTVPTPASALGHIETFNTNYSRSSAGEAIKNVYELPKLECAV